MFSKDIHSAIPCLALKWRTLGMLAVTFARQILRLKKMRAYGGASDAAMLEVWIYVALVKLSSDIAFVSQQQALNDEEIYALTYLKTVHALLSVLALTLSVIRDELISTAQRLSQLAGASVIACTNDLPRALAVTIPYLDSG